MDSNDSLNSPTNLSVRKTALQLEAERGRDDTGLVDTSDNPLLTDIKLTGFESPLEQNLKVATHLMQKSNYVTFAPLLPMMLQLKGKPYTLQDHFPFEPLFRTRMPKRTILKSGRQVSKSTSLAAHGVVSSNCIPFFSTLYITPLFEMIRRFSQNYVRPFIETSPMLKLFSGHNTINSVLQRSFKNRSQMHFSYAFLDAERTRGLSADNVVYDESIRVGTMMETQTGAQPIETFLPGDPILSFNENGYVEEDKVVKVSDHGIRDCYRFTFANGAVVEATSDSVIATTCGWKRVQVIIADLVAGADGFGDDAGRCSSKYTKQEPNIQVTTRLDSAYLQLPKIHAVTRIRTHASQESEERGIREMAECLVNINQSGVLAYRCLVSTQRQETSHTSMAQQANLGGGSLVDHGRRRTESSYDENLDTQFHQERSGFDDSLVSIEGARSQDTENTVKAYTWAQLLHSDVLYREYIQAGGIYPSICFPGDELQDRTTDQEHDFSLRLVRDRSDRLTGPECLQRKQECGLLQEQELLKETTQQNQPSVYGKTREEACEACESSGNLSQGYREESQEKSGVRKSCLPRQSGALQSSQTQTSGRESSSTSTASTCVSRLSAAVYDESESGGTLLRTGMQTQSQSRVESSVRLEAADIVSVEWLGKHQVYDLEVEKNHTFIAGGVAVSNCQDMDAELLPIINETMSGSIDWGIIKYAGTPKTLDNTLETLWTDSSMAEWLIQCRTGGCNHWNIPALEHDMLDMIGPYRDDISEKEPGIVCAKCRKPLNPRPTSQGGTGRWVHRLEERRWDFAGYHIPQMIMPMHYANDAKWATLLGKQAGRGNTPINVFFNEVCGESYDSGSKMVTITDLKRAAVLPWDNKVDEAIKCIDEYTYRFCAVDWGGGGVKNGRSDMKYTSYTSIAVIGMSPNGEFHVLYGYRSLNPFEHVREAKLVLGVMSKFRCSHLVHDYTGAGTVRETIIHQAGLPGERIISVAMQGAAKGGLFQFKPATDLHPRDHFKCDKPRSLNLTCQMIKSGIVKFFKYDNHSSEDRGVLSDFLNLIEEKSGSSFDIYKIIKDPSGPDDFAQAVNIGIMAMCHMTDRWPDFAAYVKAEISDELMQAAHPVHTQEWEDI